MVVEGPHDYLMARETWGNEGMEWGATSSIRDVCAPDRALPQTQTHSIQHPPNPPLHTHTHHSFGTHTFKTHSQHTPSSPWRVTGTGSLAPSAGMHFMSSIHARESSPHTSHPCSPPPLSSTLWALGPDRPRPQSQLCYLTV